MIRNDGETAGRRGKKEEVEGAAVGRKERDGEQRVGEGESLV